MRGESRYVSIEGDDLFLRMAMGEPIVVVDVRTETEFEKGHVPGSMLLPLHELETRLEEIPNGGTPIAVVCAHGLRSVSACRFLGEHGFSPLYNVRHGLDQWPGPLVPGSDGHPHPHDLIAPTRFLVENFELLPKGLVLDLAMGNGRNAIFFATRGFDVDGVDVDAEVVARARATGRRLGAPIRAVVGNVEDGTYIIPIETYDVIAVFNFLHRPLFNDIRSGIKSGGAVIYQTYTTEQVQFGSPKSPAHLLEPGELRRAFSDWEILRYNERIEPSKAGGPPAALAGIVAIKP